MLFHRYIMAMQIEIGWKLSLKKFKNPTKGIYATTVPLATH